MKCVEQQYQDEIDELKDENGRLRGLLSEIEETLIGEGWSEMPSRIHAVLGEGVV